MCFNCEIATCSCKCSSKSLDDDFCITCEHQVIMDDEEERRFM